MCLQHVQHLVDEELFDVKSEYFIDGVWITADIAIVPKQGVEYPLYPQPRGGIPSHIPIAIEIDGPSHYCADAGNERTPIPGTAWKKALLKAHGWALVNVPYWRFGEVSKPAGVESLLKCLGRAKNA